MCQALFLAWGAVGGGARGREEKKTSELHGDHILMVTASESLRRADEVPVLALLFHGPNILPLLDFRLDGGCLCLTGMQVPWAGVAQQRAAVTMASCSTFLFLRDQTYWSFL